MGSLGASCFHTLTTETRDVRPGAWDDERFGMVCTQAQTFADWKKVIEKLCSISGRCDYKTKQQIKAFFLKINRLEQKAWAQ